MILLIVCLLQQILVQADDLDTEELIFTVSSACRCSQIKSVRDCNQKCLWVGDPNTGYCKDRMCKENKSLEKCENLDEGEEEELEGEEDINETQCYFQNGICKILSDCKDLELQSCRRSSRCFVNVTANNECQEIEDESVICYSIQESEEDAPQDEGLAEEEEEGEEKASPTEILCIQSIQSTGGESCTWFQDEGKYVCKAFPMSTCYDLDQYSVRASLRKPYCEKYSDRCVYQKNQILTGYGILFKRLGQEFNCVNRQCAHWDTESECNNDDGASVIIDDDENTVLCHWNQEAGLCEDGLELKALTAETCYDGKTLFQLTFDQKIQQCTKCPGAGLILNELIILCLIFMSF